MNDFFKTTYKQESGPPAMALDQYEETRTEQYERLLSHNPIEREVQAFFEKNPSFVPGAWTPGSKSGHYPLHCALISQPKLPGFKYRQPDFMWISTHSGAWYPTLIEIEAPRKKIFTRKGIPTSDFTEARNQLAQWRTWFNNPANVQQFLDSYGIPNYLRVSRKMQLHMILIYGRRNEFDENPELSQQRASLLPSYDEELISFDRLSVDKELEHSITIRAVGFGKYKVINIPPIFSLSPCLAERLCQIDGFEKAIDETEEIFEERKEFLKKRILYWREWVQKSSSRMTGRYFWE
jgi:hypothetical protein